MNDNKFLQKWISIWGFGIIVFIVFATLGFFFWVDHQIYLIPFYILLSSFSFWFIHYWYEKLTPEGAKTESQKNPYRKIFFGGVNILTFILLVAGFFSAFMIFTSVDGNIYEALAVVIFTIWCIVFLKYFIWSVYYYNINYGLTDRDWEKIFQAREDEAKGIKVSEGSTEAPLYNPFRSQTFGLPPGTVRGMIAFTLLFAAIALTIVSMGMDPRLQENTFFWDYFEFIKTAFLMMIAFYFGDRSLKYLSKRWPQNQSNKEKNNENIPDPKEDKLNDDLDEEDEFLKQEDKSFANESGLSFEETEVNPTAIKKILQDLDEEIENDRLSEDYIQIKDMEFSKFISDENLEDVIESLKSNDDIEIQLPVLKAIIDIESAGNGFLKDGRAKILFEGHKFWQNLKEPEKYLSGNEDILYKKWTRKFYKGGTGEYERLQRAINIDKKAAIYSASYGKFQILGENLNHYIKKRLFEYTDDPNKDDHADIYYKDFEDFFEKQHESEYYHLLDFIEFIKTKKIKGKALVNYVAGDDDSQFDWATFAYGYNGSGYKKNNYDIKLKRAYEKFCDV